MDVFIVLIIWIKGERDSTEPPKTVFIEKDLQWVNACHDYVDTHVELIPVYKQGVLYVTLYYDGFSVIDLREFINE